MKKIVHTEGCVTVFYEKTATAPGHWDVEVRAQTGEDQHLCLTTDIAVDRLISALTKVQAAKGALL